MHILFRLGLFCYERRHLLALMEYYNAPYLDLSGLPRLREISLGAECDDLSGAPVDVVNYRIRVDCRSEHPHGFGRTNRVNGGGRRSTAQDHPITTAVADQLP